MNSLMSQYKLLDYYRDLESVKKPLWVLDELIKQHYPKLAAHLVKRIVKKIM